jgi:hypothetical protein
MYASSAISTSAISSGTNTRPSAAVTAESIRA